MKALTDVLARVALTDRLAPMIVPAFVIVCVALGGASQENLIQAGVLQLLAVACLLWVVLDGDLEDMPEDAIGALWLFGGFFFIAAIQVIPLPPDVWTRLPAREHIRAGFEAFGGPLPWLPLSLAPEKTLFSVLQILPPLAVFLMTVKLRWRHAVSPMPWVVPLIGAASVALGAIQVMGSAESALYFYPTTNHGFPVGFFSNANHQASFLVMCLPFVAATIGTLRQRSNTGSGDIEKVAIALALGATCVIGVVVAGSIAGYILLGPVLLVSFPIARGRADKGMGGRFMGLFVVGVLAIAALLATSPFVAMSGIFAGNALDNGHLSRPEIFANTIAGLKDHGLLGAGLGAFQQTYPFYEDPNIVSTSYAAHAHNDYLEMAFEAGLPGIALIGGLIVWWVVRTAAIWAGAGGEEARIRRAASVATGVVLLHSLVDYPLRTNAVSVVAAFALAAMVASRRRTAPADGPQDTDARNIVL